MGKAWPATLDEAVGRLMGLLSQQLIDHIRGSERAAMVAHHFSLGLYIRNEFGLRAGNEPLKRSCGWPGMDPDDASMVILYALWDRIHQDEATPQL